MTSTKYSIPIPTPENTPPAVRNPGVPVELEPGEVSVWWKRSQKESRTTSTAALQVYWYGITAIS